MNSGSRPALLSDSWLKLRKVPSLERPLLLVPFVLSLDPRYVASLCLLRNIHLADHDIRFEQLEIARQSANKQI